MWSGRYRSRRPARRAPGGGTWGLVWMMPPPTLRRTAAAGSAAAPRPTGRGAGAPGRVHQGVVPRPYRSGRGPRARRSARGPGSTSAASSARGGPPPHIGRPRFSWSPVAKTPPPPSMNSEGPRAPPGSAGPARVDAEEPDLGVLAQVVGVEPEIGRRTSGLGEPWRCALVTSKWTCGPGVGRRGSSGSAPDGTRTSPKPPEKLSVTIEDLHVAPEQLPDVEEDGGVEVLERKVHGSPSCGLRGPAGPPVRGGWAWTRGGGGGAVRANAGAVGISGAFQSRLTHG